MTVLIGVPSLSLPVQVIVDTPTSPVTSGLPLFFVITVTAIKQVSDGAVAWTPSLPLPPPSRPRSLLSSPPPPPFYLHSPLFSLYLLILRPLLPPSLAPLPPSYSPAVFPNRGLAPPYSLR